MAVSAFDWKVAASLVGATGAAIVALLTARLKREQHLRERMIEATSTFSADARKAVQTLRGLDPLTGYATRKAEKATTDAPFGERTEATLAILEPQFENVRSSIAELHAQRARIADLFAPKSFVTTYADLVIAQIDGALLYIDRFIRNPDQETYDQYKKRFDGAEASLDRLAEEARKSRESPLAPGGRALRVRTWSGLRRLTRRRR